MSFKVLRAPTLTQMWHDVTRWHLTKREVDLKLGIGTNLNNVILEAQSASFQFDLREVWLNPQRWTILTREYIDGPEMMAFLDRSRIIMAGKGAGGVITNFHFRGVTRREKKHKWGNCLLAATFRGSYKKNGLVQPTLTLHSRVSYNAYMLGLDMGLAHTIARYIAEPLGFKARDIRIQWHLDVLQLHSFKCLPYLYTQPDLMAVLEDPVLLANRAREYPTWDTIARWWRKVMEFEASGKTLEEEKYGPFRRIRRRYEEYKSGILVPSTPISRLDFTKVEGFNEALRKPG